MTTYRADLEILFVSSDNGDRVRTLGELVRQLEEEQRSNPHLFLAAVWFDDNDNAHAALDTFDHTGRTSPA
jgi:hypothetical protein